jgi:hypothetical protein
MRASFAEHGSALRRERADGRRTDAHDPCGLLGAVAVHVEQDEGGALARREVEQHATDVLPEVDLVERVVVEAMGTSLRVARTAARVRIRNPFSATRNKYPVGSSIRSIMSHRSHSLRKASCMSSAESARFPVTKYRALNSRACSSAKNAEKSCGACSAAGNLMTSLSACIALLDAAGASSA